jgi:GST-like protein
MQWLFWQMGGIGPIGGQLWHFRMFAPRIAPDFDNSYARNRYDHMFAALWETMDQRLETERFLAGEYSIADMACFPWIAYLEPERGIAAYPNVLRWRDEIAGRSAVRAAYEKVAAVDAGYERAENGAVLFPWEGLLANVIVV